MALKNHHDGNPFGNDRTFGETGSSQRGYGCQQPRNGPASPGGPTRSQKMLRESSEDIPGEARRGSPQLPIYVIIWRDYDIDINRGKIFEDWEILSDTQSDAPFR